MQTFVDGITDLRLLVDGRFSLNLGVFDPQEVLRTVCDIFRHQAEAQKVSLSYEICDRLQLPSSEDVPLSPPMMMHSLPKLIGDDRRLMQVIFSLVRNVFKSALRGDRVQIRVCYDTSESLLIV